MPLISDGVKHARLPAGIGLGAVPGVVAEKQSIARLHLDKRLARIIDPFLGYAMAFKGDERAAVNASPGWIVVIRFVLD